MPDNYKGTPFKLLVEVQPVHPKYCHIPYSQHPKSKQGWCNCYTPDECFAFQMPVKDDENSCSIRVPDCIERERYAALEAAGQMSLVQDVPGKVEEITNMLYAAFSHLLLAVIYDTLHHHLNPSQLQLLHDGTLEHAIARRLEEWKIKPGGTAK